MLDVCPECNIIQGLTECLGLLCFLIDCNPFMMRDIYKFNLTNKQIGNYNKIFKV